LKEEALDRTLWRIRFGKGYGPVVRQNTEWMNEWMNIFRTVLLNDTWNVKAEVLWYMMLCRWFSISPDFEGSLCPSLQGKTFPLGCLSLKMNAIRSFEKPGSTVSTTFPTIPKHLDLQKHSCEKLKFLNWGFYCSEYCILLCFWLWRHVA
jgi:hypothetical protein